VVRALAAVFLVVLGTAGAATAKDGVSFDRTRAHVGDRLVLASSYNAHPHGLIAYFLPLSVSAKWWRIPYTGGWETPSNGPPPKVRGVIRLGPLHSNGRAVKLVFRVPQVKPARYVLGIWCKPCNEHWTTALPDWQPNPLGILRVVA
jgi:hypothetical protein